MDEGMMKLGGKGDIFAEKGGRYFLGLRSSGDIPNGTVSDIQQFFKLLIGYG